jgi:hypothetical protein
MDPNIAASASRSPVDIEHRTELGRLAAARATRSVEDVEHDEAPDQQGPGEPPALGEEDQREAVAPTVPMMVMASGVTPCRASHAAERVDRVTHPCAGVNVESRGRRPFG